MTAPKTVLFNTLEQILSADLVRIGTLVGKAVMDSMLRTDAGILHTTPRDVVLRGWDASAGAGLTVDITAGAGARFEAAVGADLSNYELGETTALVNVPGLTPDGVSDRVALISAAISATTTDSTIRNILTLPSRVVTPTLIDKTSISDVTFNVTLGTPAALPTFPATPAGEVPLFYVYLPAAAASVTDNFIMDARSIYSPSAFSRAHNREHGLYVSSAGARDEVFIGSGRGFQNGALIDFELQGSRPHAQLTADGVGTIAASTEYHVYLVGRGAGDPVGKNLPDLVVPIISTTAPNADGRPSAALTYRPLFVHSVNNVRRTTTEALWIGVIHSDSGSLYQIGGDGIPLNRDGTLSAQLQTMEGPAFWPGDGPGWLHRPQIEWASVSTITVGFGVFMISGIPGTFFGGTADMASDVVSGDTADGASTWYYIYLRPRVSPSTITRGYVRDYQLVLSTEAPTAFGNAPSGVNIPEAGFNAFDYLYVGAVFNNSAQDFQRFWRVGEQVHWQVGGVGDTRLLAFAAPAVSPAVTTLTMLLPALGLRVGLLEVQVLSSGGIAATIVVVRHQTGLGAGGNALEWDQGGFGGVLPAEGHSVLNGWVEGDGSNQCELTTDSVASGTLEVKVTQRGYLDALAS